jgi:uncharacterized membrane protein
MSTSPHDPYRPPAAAVADTDTAPPAGFGPPGRKLPAGRGAAWISEGWELFRRAPLAWIGAMLLLVIAYLAVGAIPVLGSLAGVLAGPMLGTGAAAFAHGVDRHGQPDFSLLGAGFRDRFGALLGVALLNLAFSAGIVVAAVLGWLAVVGGHLPHNPQGVEDMAASAGLGLALVALLALALLIPLAAAVWYAPALVYFAGMGPLEAMRESLRACLHNWLPMLVYSLLALFMTLLGAMALLVGLLVVVPVLAASYYTSFRDIYGQRE